MSKWKYDLRGAIDNEVQKAVADIVKQKDNVIAIEFTRVICDFLKENGVTVEMTEIEEENHDTNKFEVKYGFAFTGLNFSEHDKKVTKEKDAKIADLEHMLNSWIETATKRWEETIELERKIEDLEAIIADGKKPDISVSKNGVSIGCECGGYHLAKERIAELEDRHQSDCIRINQLLTTIDVLTDRCQKLREVHGL